MAKSTGVGKGSNKNSHNIPAVKKNGGRLQRKLNTFQHEELVQKCIECMLADLPRKEIKIMVSKEAPTPLSEQQILKVMEYATARMEEISKQDAPLVIANHVDLYERIWVYFDTINNPVGANKAMRGKEKILGLLKDKNKLVINNQKTTVIERVVQYDTEKLSSAEKDRMNFLINKSK